MTFEIDKRDRSKVNEYLKVCGAQCLCLLLMPYAPSHIVIPERAPGFYALCRSNFSGLNLSYQKKISNFRFVRLRLWVWMVTDYIVVYMDVRKIWNEFFD